MNNALRIAVAAAVVLVIAYVGIRLLPSSGTGGPSSPTPTLVESTSPSSTPMVIEGDAILEAGTYVWRPLKGPDASIEFTLDVPAGWTSEGRALVPAAADSDNGGIFVLADAPHGLFSDPCNADGKPGNTDVTIGVTAEDLANAFAAQTAYEHSLPADVTLGGYSGKTMDLLMPITSCNEGRLFIWEGSDSSVYADPGHDFHLWILDVEGKRIVIFFQDSATTPDALKAEARAMVESIQIQP